MPDALGFGALRGPVRSVGPGTQTGAVDEQEGESVVADLGLQPVTGGAGLVRDDRAVIPGDAVEQRALARVHRPEQQHARQPGPVILQPGLRRDPADLHGQRFPVGPVALLKLDGALEIGPGQAHLVQQPRERQACVGPRLGQLELPGEPGPEPVGDALGLGHGHLAMTHGAVGELPRSGRPGAGAGQARQEALDDQRVAVAGDLGRVLPCVGSRRNERRDQEVIEAFDAEAARTTMTPARR